MPRPRSLSSQALPEGFPVDTPSPRFAVGMRASWQPLPSQDFGIITGMEYAPMPDFDGWGWRYTVWLDARSPSAQWIPSDLAWEEDLLLLTSGSPGEAVEATQL